MARILLVEDDEFLSETLDSWLSGSGYTVVAVYSGSDGLEQMRYGEFDLVILDGRLPDLDGVEVCRQYRQEGGKCPVLMMTGNTGAGEKEKGLAAGVNEYVRKPFELKIVEEKIKALLAVSTPADA